jgi:succinoglycan biosynthesis transport protein ExoP
VNYVATDDQRLAENANYLFAALRRRMKLMLSVAALVLALVLIYLLLATRVYTASATVIVDPRQRQVLDPGPVLSGLEPDASIVETEMQMMRSRPVAAQVARDLKLAGNPNFTPSGGLKAAIKSLVSGEQGADSPLEVQRSVEDKLLDELSVTRAGTSYAIRLAYDSTDPELASKIVNRFATVYIENQVGVKEAAEQQVNRVLGSRISNIRDELRRAESAVASYRVRNGLLNAVNPALTEQTIASLDTQYAQARGELAQQRGRASAATADQLVVQSPVIQSLRREQAAADVETAKLNARYGPNHPLVTQARQDSGRIQQLIAEETSRVVGAYQRNAGVDVSGAQQRVAAESQALGRARSTLATNNMATIQLSELERNAASLRTLYESYLNRFKETSAGIGLQAPDSRIISLSVPPRVPSSPRVMVTLAVGIFLSVFCALAAGVIAELAMLWAPRQPIGDARKSAV